MGVKIKLDTFEGPLDLLLHLIERAEVDIWEVSISRITDQYMSVLREMQELELDVASDFLVMAATLLAIKSRMLLPRQEPEELGEEEAEEEIDPREQLTERLIEYKKYRKLAEVLGEREQERLQVQLFHLIGKHSGHSWQEIEDFFLRDRFLSAPEALAYGLVDEILGDIGDVIKLAHSDISVNFNQTV